MSDELAAIQERTFAGATSATVGSYPPGRRLSARQLADYLDRRVFAVIGGHVVVLVEGTASLVAPADVPADVRAAVTGDWAATWIRLTAKRLLSYAAEGAIP